jgi:serine phosphatase RsbU (regulator of sigma subunit)
MTAVKAFTKEAPQSDDITLLALQYLGRQKQSLT